MKFEDFYPIKGFYVKKKKDNPYSQVKLKPEDCVRAISEFMQLLCKQGYVPTNFKKDENGPGFSFEFVKIASKYTKLKSVGSLAVS